MTEIQFKENVVVAFRRSREQLGNISCRRRIIAYNNKQVKGWFETVLFQVFICKAEFKTLLFNSSTLDSACDS